jgi:hypothetical protein
MARLAGDVDESLVLLDDAIGQYLVFSVSADRLA